MGGVILLRSGRRSRRPFPGVNGRHGQNEAHNADNQPEDDYRKRQLMTALGVIEEAGNRQPSTPHDDTERQHEAQDAGKVQRPEIACEQVQIRYYDCSGANGLSWRSSEVLLLAMMARNIRSELAR